MASKSATVLISPMGPELTDRMYADLVNSLIWSRDSAEKRARETEVRLHELHLKLSSLLENQNANTQASV